jgi:hypothetical protein
MRPGALGRRRWAVRAGDPAGGRALRVAGARGTAPRADPRHGRHPHRPRRAGVRPRGASAVSVGTATFGDPSRQCACSGARAGVGRSRIRPTA